jgi:hypothetical protein
MLLTLFANALNYFFLLLYALTLFFDQLLPVLVEFLLKLLDQLVAVGSNLKSLIVLVHEKVFSLRAHVFFVVDEAVLDLAKLVGTADNTRHLVERGRLVHVDLMGLHCRLCKLF